MMPRASARRAWLSLFFVAVVLAGGVAWVLRDHDRQVRAAAEESFQAHLQWLRFVVANEVLRGDYDNTVRLVHHWAGEQKDVAWVRLTAGDGRRLLDYVRDGHSEILREATLPVADVPGATVEVQLAIDQGNLERTLKRFSQRVFGLLAIFFAFTAVLLHQRLLRQRQAEELAAANEVLAREAVEREAAQATMQGLEERYRLLLETSAEGIYGVDREGVCIFVNPAALRMLGYTQAAQVLGKRVHPLFHHSHANGSPYPETACRAMGALAGAGSQHVDDEFFWRADGSGFPVEYTTAPIVKGGSVVGAVITFADISERRRAEVELHKLSLAVAQSPVAVLITDRDGIIDYVSPAFERASGFTLADARGHLIEVFLQPLQAPEQTAGFVLALRSGQAWRGELGSRRRDGGTAWVRVVAAPVHVANGEISHFVVIMEDVSVEHAQAELIRYQAEYDALTGVPNRVLTLDRISQAINKARRAGHQVAVLFIDLDDFKKINDTLGHDVGDKLLVEAAQRFRTVVREGDTVGRHGGDEFLILVEEIDSAEAAERVARDVVRDFAAPFSINDVDMLVTASVGIALFPSDGGDTTTLLRNADAAMYSAKEAGRNGFRFFAPEMNQAAVHRIELERHLLGALERGEFRLCFQPQMDLSASSDHSVVAVEALLRWQSPALGNVLPLQFIPLAEQTGLIVAIGNWVLDEALRALAAWRQAGFSVPRVAVNVSPRQFQSVVEGQDLADVVTAALARHRVPAAALELEITEGLLVKNWTQTRPLLDRLHAAGVRVAMDDFGTGYSSLAYLRSFPFDTLKIDGAFVRDLPTKAEDRALVSAIVAMAASLQVAVVAEGVETAEQLAILRERGCQLAQGHLIGAPVEAAAMAAQLARAAAG